MGLQGVVAKVLGEVVRLDGPAAPGAASESMRGLISDLRKVPVSEVRDGKSPEYFEVVIEASSLEAFTTVLEPYFGPAAKPFGRRARFEHSLRSLVDSEGGILKEQCLYLRRHADHRVAYAALWPWGGGENITLKVGLYAEALPS